jgi:putative sugar O-methyltransferase
MRFFKIYVKISYFKSMVIKNLDLIKNYKTSCDYFYGNINNNIQKSTHWKVYDFRNFNLENLINFRSNNILSNGLDDQTDKFSFSVYAKIVNEISEDYVLKNLPKLNVGNSQSLVKFKNVLIDYNKLIHIHWFFTIEREVLKKNKISNICEIGGGFGSFSELFIKNYNTKVISIDLPEANLLSSYYLKETFPEKKIFLYEDYMEKQKLSKQDYENFDIFILPPNCHIDNDIKIDFFINARSMMEMNFDVIKSYFKFIEKYSHEKSYFLNINRYEKTSVGKPIRISDYPYDDNWKVVISKPSFNQNWIHFLLTKRNFNKEENDIKSELNQIREIGKKFYGLYIDYSPKYIKIKKLIRKILKIFFLNKLFYLLGVFIFKIGTKLKSLK